MDAAGWTMIVVAAIGAIGTIVLQAIHMILSYYRDKTIESDVGKVVKATNGLTEKIVSAELIAERIVVKAEIQAKALLDTAARAASNVVKEASDLAEKVAEKVAEKTKRLH